MPAHGRFQSSARDGLTGRKEALPVFQSEQKIPPAFGEATHPLIRILSQFYHMGDKFPKIRNQLNIAKYVYLDY